MRHGIKTTLFALFLETGLLAPLMATRDFGGVGFDVLVQPRPFRGEEFLEIERQRIANVPLPPETLVKYLKFASSFSVLPISDPSVSSSAFNSRDYAALLQDLFYGAYLPVLRKDPFQAIKGYVAFSRIIGPYEESASKSFMGRARDLLKSLIFESSNRIRREADFHVLYWVYKNWNNLSFLHTLTSQKDILTPAVHYPEADGRLQYAFGRSLEAEDPSAQEQALTWYTKATENGYRKAQLRLEYLKAQSGDDSALVGFHQNLADMEYSELRRPRYPYAQYVMGNWLVSQSAALTDANDINLQRGFSYLQKAALSGVPQAQDQLNQFRNQNKNLFYELCNLSDQYVTDQERFEFLKSKAEQNLFPYAYQLAQMYEDGKGVPFEKVKDWLEAFARAKHWYNSADHGRKTTQESQRIQQKIESIEKAQGYILNKIVGGATVSFSPKHPLFDEFYKLYKYSVYIFSGSKISWCLYYSTAHRNSSPSERGANHIAGAFNSYTFGRI